MTDDSKIDRPSERQTATSVSGEPAAARGPKQSFELVHELAEASRIISSASDPSTVLQAVESFGTSMTGADCHATLSGGSVPHHGEMFDMVDCMGVPRGTLALSHHSLDSEQAQALSVVLAQAGLMLGCLALQSSSAREVSARQVAEFESHRLRKLFDKRLQEALGERSIWADVFKGSQYSVCIVSPDLRYVSFNPAFEEWFTRHGDLSPSPGQSIRDALSHRPDIIAEAEECWERALAGEDFIYAWSIVSNERDYHYETRYTPLRDDGGDTKAAVQFSLDVTDRVLERRRLEVAETALRQSQKMEAVGKLTGGIAHDFNNILTGIVGAIDIIGRKMADGRLDAVPRYLDMAATSANRAASLTHRLLAFSRRQPVDPRLTDVDALVLGMGEMISRAMGPDVTVETSTSGMSARVLCDASQLESALMNLAVNGREAMPNGGRILIATGEVDIQTAPVGEDLRPGMYVRISVSDNGCGMTPEVLAHAVEPFFTTKGIGHGTGLGLSMVYGFARQSGGFLDIRSEQAEGTTVSIYLPATAALPIVPEECGTSSCSSHDATVLVVEDEPAVRAIVVELLEEMGCHVIEAEDGGQGASILSSDAKIDVLVTDIGLPVLNGRQVATVARTGRPDIPILFMTGYSENATITEGFGGRTTLVTKPFRPAQIANALERMLD